MKSNSTNYYSGIKFSQNQSGKKGLSEEQLQEFEKVMGFEFPLPLRNFYLTMNGLDKPCINVYGNSGEDAAFQPIFYSFPDDLDLIKENIDWIYKKNKTDLHLLWI